MIHQLQTETKNGPSQRLEPVGPAFTTINAFWEHIGYNPNPEPPQETPEITEKKEKMQAELKAFYEAGNKSRHKISAKIVELKEKYGL